MNHELAMKVANAVLYEGYMLYPYRQSAMKNRQRWSFGILYPPAYHEVAAETERAQMHSEILARASGDAVVHIELRFLHLATHEVAEKEEERAAAVASSLLVDGKLVESRDEGVERSVQFETAPGAPQFHDFCFPALKGSERLTTQQGQVVGQVTRTQREVKGTISLSAAKVKEGVIKLTIDVTNTSSLTDDPHDRGSALLTSLLSAHTILSITGGEFVSLLDPPDDLRQEVNECHNVGNFPVLVGAEGERDMMLCSPIVLYDYPQIAPESAGDFFDGTEMDEMLTLRVMTLTDEEKSAMLSADDRVRNLLQRTEAGAREQLMRTHGTIRSLRQVNEP